MNDDVTTFLNIARARAISLRLALSGLGSKPTIAEMTTLHNCAVELVNLLTQTCEVHIERNGLLAEAVKEVLAGSDYDALPEPESGTLH